MTNTARAGLLIYAKALAEVSTFYERVLGARVIHADDDHRVLQTEDTQIIIHAIPAQYAESIIISRPPEAREEQAFKPFFTVDRLADAERAADACGGRALGEVWPGPGIRVRNVCDPEGNILHLREIAA